MGLTFTASAHVPDSLGMPALKKSLEIGANFWNAGDFYGRPDPSLNLQYLSRYFDKYPTDADKVYLSVKGGVDPVALSAISDEQSIDRSIASVKQHLDGKKHLDMFCLARVGDVEIEESVRAIAKHIKAGNVDAICLSEVSADSIKRASKVHPISAVELEYSLWSREAETNGVFAICAELGIPVIAYSPLGRGYLTGRYKSLADIPEGDFKLRTERYTEENFQKNMALVEKVAEIAKRNNATNAQIALQWVRNHSGRPGYPVIIPIPGASSADRVAENTKEIEVSDKDWAELDQFLNEFKISGHRYSEAIAHSLYK